MLGKDCERIISNIDAIKSAIEQAILAVGSSAAYQITTEGVHGEQEIPNPASGILDSVAGMAGQISADVSKMSQLGNGLYTSTDTFNNSAGSPFTEISALSDALSSLTASITWLGDRTNALAQLQVAYGRAIDAKWAIIYYHDYIQRGYDHKYNDNNPSITFKAGLHRDTIGNVSQEYNTNVNIKEKSIDPY